MEKAFIFEQNNSATKDAPYLAIHAMNLIDYPHFHEETEFIRCENGQFEITMTDSAVTLNAGEILFFMPYEIHNIISAQNSYGTVLKMRPLTEDIAYARLQFSDKHIKKGHPAYEEMNKQFDKINHPSFPENLVIATAANELLLLAMQNISFKLLSEAESKTKLKNIAILNDVHSYLKMNYMNDISLSDVAKFCTISKYYFSRTFKDIAGVCFSDYLTKYRLNKAIDLMKSTGKTQLDIAYACGFNSFQTYAKSFERVLGTTPNKYRKSLKY